MSCNHRQLSAIIIVFNTLFTLKTPLRRAVRCSQ